MFQVKLGKPIIPGRLPAGGLREQSEVNLK